MANAGGGSGVPDPSIKLDACLRLKFLHPQNCISLFTWLNCFFVLMKRALHFATKLNSRGNQTCISFWVLSYDLFASARKAVFPAPTATGVHRLRNTWSSLLSQPVDNHASLRSRIQIHGKGPRNYNVQPRLVGRR